MKEQDSDEGDRIGDLEIKNIENNNNDIIEEKEKDDEEKKEEAEFEEIIKTDNLIQIKRLLKESEKIKNIWNYKTKENDGSTVLHCSIFYDKTKIAKEIIRYCKNNLNNNEFLNFLNKKNNKGITAFHYASFRGNVNIINYLSYYKANIFDVTDKDLNVIHFACQGNKPNSLVYFDYYHKGKFNFNQPDSKKSTPLHWATFMSAYECVLFLLNKKVKINIQDKDGNTPLHLAVIGGVSKTVRLLLQKGASNNIENKKGETPMQLAQSKNRIEIYNILKSNSKCAVCNCRAPTKKIGKSKKYIFIGIFFKIISYYFLLGNIYPFLYRHTCYGIINLVSLFLFALFNLIFIILYLYLICSNPGYVSEEDKDENYETLLFTKKDEFKHYCFKCCVHTTDDLKHCSICDKCCKEFDHHCFWLNNCIGVNNYMKFIVFLYINLFEFLTILSTSVYTLVITFEIFLNKKKDTETCVYNYNIIKKIYEFVLEHIFFFEIIYDDYIPRIPENFHINYFQILIIFILIMNIIVLIPLIYLVNIHTGLCRKKRREKATMRNINKKIDNIEEDGLVKSDSDTSLDSTVLMKKSLLDN